MRKIWLLSKYQFKRRWSNPAVAFTYLLMPVVLSAVLWFVFGPKGESFSPLKIAIVNRDQNGFLSHLLVESFKRPEAKRWLKIEECSEEEGLQLIKKGKVSALLIIPKGFSQNLWERQPTKLTLIKNPAHQIYPEMAETMLDLLSKGINFILSYFGEELDILKAVVEEKSTSAPEESFIVGTVKKVKKLFNALEKFPVELKEKKKEEKEPSLIIFFFSGLCLFFLLFFANAAMMEMVQERKKFLLRRMLISELSPIQYTLSHYLAAFLFLLSLEIILVVIGHFAFFITTQHIGLLIALLFLSSLLFPSFFGIIYSLVDEERKASNLSMIFIFFFAITGGSFLPVTALPSFLKKIAFLSPLYHLNTATIYLVLNRMKSFYPAFYASAGLASGLFIISFWLNLKATERVLK